MTVTAADVLSPTLTEMVLDAPAESKTNSVVAPFLAALTLSVAPFTDPIATRPSPAVTVYGAVPPVIWYEAVDPTPNASTAGELTNKAVDDPTVTDSEIVPPLLSVIFTVDVPPDAARIESEFPATDARTAPASLLDTE